MERKYAATEGTTSSGQAAPIVFLNATGYKAVARTGANFVINPGNVTSRQ
jgi:hypothetical protein